MEFILKKFFHHASAAINVLFRFARNVDYKTLSRYMLEINQMHDLDSILLEASKCLKEMLDYRLFAFAVQDGDVLDVWIDPSIYKKAIGKIIANDFGFNGELNIRHMNDSRKDIPNPDRLRSSDLMSYGLMEGKYVARFYIQTGRRMLQYHSEIMNIIVKTLGVAVSNFMNLKNLENAAAFDPLTNCYNRREFSRLIEHNIANAQRYGKDLSIIMFDMDHFKKINDTYGHQVGDIVLKKVCQVIRSGIRKGDYLSRYGGEEFVLVLPDTKMTRAMELAERLRKTIENQPIKISEETDIKTTASFGVAALRSDSDKGTLLQEVDAMLYKAKTSGRNTVMPALKVCNFSARHSEEICFFTAN
jgi:diguanylate cyclase (GGDEF)-like protein